MDTQRHRSTLQAHALPYADALPGSYTYTDGCRISKHGDGSCTLFPFTDTAPLSPHTETDWISHPDNPTIRLGQRSG